MELTQEQLFALDDFFNRQVEMPKAVQDVSVAIKAVIYPPTEETPAEVVVEAPAEEIVPDQGAE